MRTILTARLGLALTVAVLLAGCGKGDDGGEAANDPAGSAEQGTDPGTVAETPQAASPAPTPTGDSTIAPADIDRYRKGMAAKATVYEGAIRKLGEARTGNDTLAAIAVNIGGTPDSVAAAAAGVAVERWRAIEQSISSGLQGRAMGGPMMAQMAQADTVNLTPEQRAQARENMRQMQEAFGTPFKNFPPETAKLLNEQHTELDSLYARTMGLMMKSTGR